MFNVARNRINNMGVVEMIITKFMGSNKDFKEWLHLQKRIIQLYGYSHYWSNS